MLELESSRRSRDQPGDWTDGTRGEVCACVPTSNGNGAYPGEPEDRAARTGVRQEFLTALNNNEYGMHAEELWPLSSGETELLIAHMDAAPRLFESDAEYEAFQEFLRTSREEQKELVRRQWETEPPLF